MFTDFKNKIILITGSSKGIGFATAKKLSKYGAKVILNSHNDIEELKKSSEKIKNSDFYLCDITKDDEVRQMVEKIISKYKKIDGLVNNAGGGGWGSILDSDDEWQKSFNLDLMGAVHVCRYVLPQMEKQGYGSVVNISSMWGTANTTSPSISSFNCCKAALCKLTQDLARQFSPTIRVNGVAPGFTGTKMLLDDFDSKGLKSLADSVLLKRIAKPEEIANVIIFLLSNFSSYITGEIISANGGYLLNREISQNLS